MAQFLPRTHEHHGLDGTFAASHVLEGGPFLAYISVRALSGGDKDWTHVQIGRCVNERKSRGACGHAWAWRKGTARLSEMRCPACGGQLRQTTHELKRTFFLVPRDVIRVIATEVLHQQRVAAYSRLYEKDLAGEQEGASLEQEMIGQLSLRLAAAQQLPRRARPRARARTRTGELVLRTGGH